jgi:hypothetical protein
MQAEPINIGPGANGTPITVPTVEPELEVDDHAVEAEICKDWLRSDEGQIAKIENPGGYANVVAHLTVHNEMLSLMQMSMSPEPSDNTSTEAPQQEVNANA